MAHGNLQSGRIPILRERLLRLQGEMTVTEFADMLGLTRQTVGYYINGNRIPDSETLLQICQRCDVSADYLLGLTNDPKKTPSVIDHLGISAKAVQNITAIRNNAETADLIASLNLILEDSSLVYLLNGVTQTAAAIQSEISHLKQPRKHIVSDETGEEIDLAQLGMLGHFLESQITSKQIEQEILNNNPTLANRFVVISGEEAIDNHIERISHTFSNLVKWAAGYNELITLRNTMEE